MNNPIECGEFMIEVDDVDVDGIDDRIDRIDRIEDSYNNHLVPRNVDRGEFFDYAIQLYNQLGPVKYKVITDNIKLSAFPLGSRVVSEEYPRGDADKVTVIVIGYCNSKLKLTRASTRDTDKYKLPLFEGFPQLPGKKTGYTLF